MRRVYATWGVFCLAAAIVAGAQPASPDDLASVHKVFKAGAPGVTPYVSIGEDGYIESLVAPPGSQFELDGGNKSTDVSEAAKAFLLDHRGALGLKSPRTGLAVETILQTDDTTAVKVRQTYNGVPVYGAQINVSVSSDRAVRGLVSDVMRDAARLDRESAPTTPSKSPEEAAAAAAGAIKSLFRTETAASEPSELVIYDPAVVGETGSPHLAYRTVVRGGSLSNPLAVEVLTDAHTNEPLLRYSLICAVKSRQVYDLDLNPFGIGELVRSEGEGPVVGNDDANDLYDFMGETYDFFLVNHGRDGLDDMGGVLRGVVHLPIANAFFTDDPIYGPYTAYGDDMATDDIVAHELTHGVTNFTSELIYLNESGAINESLSDIWGEALDITNGSDDDTPANRWLVGEGSALGVIRSMKDPTQFDHPDRYGAFLNLPIFIDNGGVHINSGIGNKLFYLLVDGGLFNTYAVEPMDMFQVLDLFYRAQTSYLTKSTDYAGLFSALMLSASDLAWSTADVANLLYAGAAVEIVQTADGLPLRGFRAQSRPNSNAVVLTWSNPASPLFSDLYLVRNLSRFPENDSDGVIIELDKSDSSYVDGNLSAGQNAYYKLVATFGDGSIAFAPQALFAREQAGAPVIEEYLSEEFADLTDLSFKQLLFSPVGDWTAAYESSRPSDYLNHSYYNLSVTHGVNALPVLRQNAASLPLPEDRAIVIPESVLGAPIPFYGRSMNSVLLSPNGFIAPAEPMPTSMLSRFPQFNLPSYASHWAIPRLSALFADLSPASGGDVWTRRLPDRFVITFENVPEHGVYPRPLSTFQMELYYSGHIRVTYLDVGVREAVVGLSDGRGVPRDPAVAPNPAAAVYMSDLSSASTVPAFNILPIAQQFVTEGEAVGFSVSVAGAASSPVITVENLPPGATFNAATREFLWLTGRGDRGSYRVAFRAASGQSVAYQDVFIVVRAQNEVPTVTDLALLPQEPMEGESLSVVYTYDEPNSVSEGASDILWYRNGAYISGLANQLGVPSEALVAGDLWTVAVVPRSALGVKGAPVWSETVTVAPASKADVNGDKKVDAVDIQLVINAVLGKAVGVLDGDANLDGEVNAADVQLVINKALK